MKNNEELVRFTKQRDYIMVNNDLGRGSLGKTVLLQDPFIDELIVAKKYEPDPSLPMDAKEKFYKNFLDEIKILYKLNHRNIVRVYNYYAHEDISTGYILMEYIEGSTIGDFITNDFVPSEQISLDNMFSQLIDAFQHIEKHKIAHRDIRESNIMIDITGTVKIIDFGLGKIFEPTVKEINSLNSIINRENSDILPQERYDGTYSSKTDMFYLAELLKRLLGNAGKSNDAEFSYHDILNKMIKINPDERFSDFTEIREIIDKYNFRNTDISAVDKEIYQNFTNSLSQAITSFLDERKFRYDINRFVSKLENTLRNNSFEDIIQDNRDIIRSIICGKYRYKSNIPIFRVDVEKFLNWFKNSTSQMQQLIHANIISKLSIIKVISDYDIPF
jgi:serine/threonine-protein kinase